MVRDLLKSSKPQNLKTSSLPLLPTHRFNDPYNVLFDKFDHWGQGVRIGTGVKIQACTEKMIGRIRQKKLKW